MNPLGEQVLVVAKEYLGPAAQQFLSKELRALECTADTITPWHLPALSERARMAAQRIMEPDRAGELATKLAALAIVPGTPAAPTAAPSRRVRIAAPMSSRATWVWARPRYDATSPCFWTSWR